MERSKMTPESPWEPIEPGVAHRVDKNGRHDFFWSRMPDRSPALVLRLDNVIKPIQPLPKLRHVGAFYRVVEGRNCYCLTLNERSHLDLFETLCRDVVGAAEAAEDLQSALQRAVRRTMRWHHLLRGGGLGLSIEEQRGLVGELTLLRELVAEIGPMAAAEAWRGPEESAKDFELPGLYIECKARRSAAHPKVRISSEAQLMDIPGARLFLRVQDVDTALDGDGGNLVQHVERTGTLFENDFVAYDVWEQRLIGTGYDPELVEENRTWHLGAVRMFEVRDGFPRIVPPLPAGVEAVEYGIRLSDCADFQASGNLKQLFFESKCNV
ncbi:putative PD-(D/E)XK family protein DUF4420 [Brevirhabdus pacifica]|nr:PD-(D/E)XK motif protein [Brevirhabdus pacifica]PJJ86034.1 putative PD-(D/E)XK family protein DUF4420 [Brevirhabdus pacifica]